MFYKEFWIIIFKILINKLIKNGKKNIALKIIIKVIIKLNKKNLIWKNIICKCLLKIKPILILRIILKRHKKILIPNIINFEKELKIATHWLIESTKNCIDSNKQFYKKLTNEILETLYNKKVNSRTLLKKKQFNTLLLNNSNIPPFLNIKITKRKKKW